LKVEFVSLAELDEFIGWDNSANAPEFVFLVEYQHAWKEFFNAYMCPIQVKPQSFESSKNFCQRVGLPFRWFLRWSIQILEHFPRPWELNLHWLQAEVEQIWLDAQNVKVLKGVDPSWQLPKILKAHHF